MLHSCSVSIQLNGFSWFLEQKLHLDNATLCCKVSPVWISRSNCAECHTDSLQQPHILKVVYVCVWLVWWSDVCCGTAVRWPMKVAWVWDSITLETDFWLCGVDCLPSSIDSTPWHATCSSTMLAITTRAQWKAARLLAAAIRYNTFYNTVLLVFSG